MGQIRQDDTRTELSRPGEPGLTTRMVEKGIHQQQQQFAYKENASTVQCASVICEVTNYYINNDGCIYMCMLDASKAFDRVTILVWLTNLS